MKYFLNAASVETVKIVYRNLAKQFHPDLGGHAEIMKEINNQYQDALKRCDGQTVQTDIGEKSYKYNAEEEKEIMEKLLFVLKFRNIDAYLIGVWLWVSGDTKPIKEELKEQGFLWHREKGMWFTKPASQNGRKYRGKGNFSGMAAQYGFQRYQTGSKEGAMVAA